MPKKSLLINTNDLDQGPLEKSMSSPEISEIAKELNRIGAEQDMDEEEAKEALRRNDSQKQRKGSWLSRLLRTFRRKRRKTTEPFAQPQAFLPVQKSPSAQFYTAPPPQFLAEVTTTDDEVDTPQQKSEIKSLTVEDEINRDLVTRGSLRLYGRPPNPNFVEELKITLNEEKKGEDLREQNDSPTYGNIAKLKNPASTRRKVRPMSADSSDLLEQRLSDFSEIYEPTWKVMPNDPKLKSILKPSQGKTEKNIDQDDANRVPDLEPQPIEPLHKFPKPKPPVNRRPSTRRGSQPEVHIRNGHLVNGNEVLMSNRRSNAELEELIHKLSDIPAPDLVTAPDIEPTASPITPTPRKRTKFFEESMPDSLPVQELVIDEEINKPRAQTSLDKDLMTLDETYKPKVEELWEKALSIVKEIERDARLDEDQISQEKRLSLTRTNSFPRVKLISEYDKAVVVLVDNLKDNLPKKEHDKSGFRDNLEHNPYKRWNTLPTRYYWKLGELVQQPVQPSTILLLPLKDDKKSIPVEDESNLPQIAVLLNSDFRPTTQTISTQTCSTLSTDITQEEIALSSELNPEPIDEDIKEYAKDSTETDLVDQHTPPNTPEQDPEIDLPDTLENNYQNEINNSATYQESVHASSAQLWVTSKTFKSSGLRHENEGNITTTSEEGVSNDRYKISRGIGEIEMISPNEALSKFRSNLKHVSTHENYYSEIKSNMEVQHEIVGSKIGLPSSESQVQETIKSGKDIIVLNYKETLNPPAKPQRLMRKPHITPKPVFLTKPQDFVRRGALRQKRNSTSEEHSSTPIYVQHEENPLGISDVSANSGDNRRSSLFQEIEEPPKQESIKAKRRTKSII